MRNVDVFIHLLQMKTKQEKRKQRDAQMYQKIKLKKNAC